LYLERVLLKNFRLLRDVDLALENNVTLVVGRNNSGKTSLSEVIRRFTSDKNASFQIQDFSVASYDDFCKAVKAKYEGKEEHEVRALIPYIELRIVFQYDPTHPQFGQLGEFVIDLDMECNEALAVMRYELRDGAIEQLFEGYLDDELAQERRPQFFHDLGERIPKLYTVDVWAEDPNDGENRKSSSQAAVKALLKTGFINAQRGLDDETIKESDVLAKILEALFSNASLETANDEERVIAAELEAAVKSIQEDIDGDFRDKLEKLLPTLNTLGYPGLSGPELTTETTLNVQRLLTNHTKVRYQGHSGVLLPESYNGLGMRNLIFILLQIYRFYRDFRAQPEAPGVHLVFIEEPEAHLHPQMQEVFIRQLDEIVKQLNAQHSKESPWPVQFVVSTHASHIANEANFETIRYFLPTAVNESAGVWKTTIKDLRRGLVKTTDEDKKFLHQYLTLTRCDLFFSDKAVLIEGTSERLLLPIMIAKRDEADTDEHKLRSQYMTVMEVGGAYAHKFFGLLEFLELQSLVITDLDPVEKSGGKKCLVHEAKATSNACIKDWFDGEACIPNDLILKSEDDKTKGRVRIAYQSPEADGDPCGRTLEDAFMLANPEKFSVTGETKEEQERDAREKAEQHKKSEFALTHAIDQTDWVTPAYIREGLNWLATMQASPPDLPGTPADSDATEDSVAAEGVPHE